MESTPIYEHAKIRTQSSEAAARDSDLNEKRSATRALNIETKMKLKIAGYEKRTALGAAPTSKRQGRDCLARIRSCCSKFYTFVSDKP
ncbi:hypothetical protein NDU88_004020 [Pleurodeles waltl]|uniref:Uncharacterized protein n=1 Tax=Pleurodeles waltl TaxID=8319 RepID=A0AAV7W7T8_PLEWA|nr:hypothetical protein NDU88_004020 [Pleurodeles waltl]